MTDLDKCLSMLKSPMASVRYEACEELRVASESSPEVILALEVATQDEDEDVAERARQALRAEIHQQMGMKMGKSWANSEMEPAPSVEPEPEQPVMMSDNGTYQKIRRILLWGLPFLFGGFLILFAFLPQVFRNEEQAYQAMHQQGWTNYLHEYYEGGYLGGGSEGEIAIDKSGRIAVAGGCIGLAGLHVFDGAEWIHHGGNYCDLALGQQGEIWAVDSYGEFIDVFDGQEKRTYQGSELGIGEQEIYQVEVDSNGRIWIVTGDYPVYQVAEVLIQQDKATATIAHPVLTTTDGSIESLDADNQGRIWAAVRRGDDPNVEEEWGGLNVFDGETWEHVYEQGAPLQYVVRTAFDK